MPTHQPLPPDLVEAITDLADAIRQQVDCVQAVADPRAVATADTLADRIEALARATAPPPGGWSAAIAGACNHARHAAVDLDPRPVLLLGVMCTSERVLALAAVHLQGQ